jgi:hypothetical protein
MTKEADELAELRAELAAQKKEIAALKKAAEPPPPSTFKPMSDAEHADWAHQMREKRANSWRPTGEVLRAMTSVDYNPRADLAALNTAVIPRSAFTREDQDRGRGRARPARGDGTGWARERSIGPSEHQRYVDAQIDAQDAKDKAERLAQEARTQAALRRK